MSIAQLRKIALSVLLAFAVCGAVMPSSPPHSVYVMRHLQKATGPDPGLTNEGRSNARRLAYRFGRYGLSAIYVSTTRRARETAAPLAARLRLTPKLYDPSDTAGLIARVNGEPGRVLIVGHSNTVPDIVERLGGARPADISEDRFGDIWQVYGPRRKVKLQRL